MAISEVVKEIRFIVQVLKSMGFEVELPIVVHVDNEGAIYIANNPTNSDCTKHVDVRYKYVNEFVEDGVIKIIFVRSADNRADIMTKNTGGELQNKHAEDMVWDIRDAQQEGC